MASPSTRFTISRNMSIYDPLQQISMWESTFEDHISPIITSTSATTNTGILQHDHISPIITSTSSTTNSVILQHGHISPIITSTSTTNTGILQHDLLLHNESEYSSLVPLEPSADNQVARSNYDKSQRRLAQNREAARKCRMRKKAYVQELESSRLKLAQLEQELVRAKQLGAYAGNTGNTGCVSANSGIVTFEMEYALWIEEQVKKTRELRNMFESQISDADLHVYVESGINHYYDLFRIKANAAKADAFYLISGMWKTSVERVFLWIGGFRPSDLLSVLVPKIESLTDQQLLNICNVKRSCQQAEDSLTQGMEKLQHTLVQSITPDYSTGAECYGSEISAAIEQLDSLEGLLNQADYLREQTLREIYRNLTTRQAARGLLVLGEYLQRLRALTSIWLARPRQLETP